MDNKETDGFLVFDRDTVRLKGEWTIFNAGALKAATDYLLANRPAVIDASSIDRLDSGGAWQLRRLTKEIDVRLTTQQQDLMKLIAETPRETARPRKRLWFVAAFADLGHRAESALVFLYDIMTFIGAVSACFAGSILRPRHFRLTSIVRHVDETGLRALPIIGLLAVLMSMVISYQAAMQLNKFGASIFTIDLTVISLLREMGVLVTAIMVAGRSGSAFAAEIGVMKLREEVDALKTIGLDPIEVLVLPRVIALLLVLPLLTFLSDVIGLAGGAIMSISFLEIPLDQYLERVRSVGTPTMFFVGMIKAPVFAFLIAVIGCYQGLNVSGSAESVGRLTTVAVVQSIFVVILTDALFSIVFANMGI